jgi:hypothetical protein
MTGYGNAHPEDTYTNTHHDTQSGFPLEDDHLVFNTFQPRDS